MNEMINRSDSHCVVRSSDQGVSGRVSTVDRENQLMRLALVLMGFDPERLIHHLSNEQSIWIETTLGALTIRVDREKAWQLGAGPRATATMDLVLENIRKRLPTQGRC